MASKTKFHDRDTLLYNVQPVLQHVVFVARASFGRSGSKGLWFSRVTSSFRTSYIVACPLNPPNLNPQYGVCKGLVHGGTASFRIFARCSGEEPRHETSRHPAHSLSRSENVGFPDMFVHWERQSGRISMD